MEPEFRSESPAAAPSRPSAASETTERFYTDCRERPSVSHCSLVIAGTREEVERAAYEHALSVHGETPGEELRESVRRSLRPVPTGEKTLA